MEPCPRRLHGGAVAFAAEQTNAVDDREHGSINDRAVWHHYRELRSTVGGAPARN
jgi:hypothetical protein